MSRYYEKYPEKLLAKNAVSKIKKPPGIHGHHWSYNPDHLLSTISMAESDHNLLHRFIVYDQERKMYRDLDGVLLDTMDSHINLLKNIKKQESGK